MRIAIDAFGTDARPKPDVEGSWLAAREFPEDEFVLVGDLAVVEAELSQYDVLANLRVVHAPYDVKMTASAVDALKEGDESSLHIGLRLVESGSADAFVTMGNTGATHSIAMLKTLGRIHGIKRPAISALYPINGRVVAFLDIGANTDCKPDWLVQFGELGSIYMKTALQMEAPKVALMSIGEEQAKGNAAVQAAYDLLSTSSLDFVGNIEPKDLLTSEVNVVIMDGFVGNLFLKTFESAMSYVTNVIRSEIRAGLVSSVGGLLIAPAIGRVRARLDPLEIGGAPLLGVDGIVIIGHGRSNARTVRNAVQQARQAVSGGTLQRLRAYFNGKSTMELTRRGLKRVVVTGVGAVTALGHASEMKSALVAGHSGIRTLQGVALDRIGIHYGAQVLADVSSTLVSRKELRRMGKASRFALAAAIEAATDAGLTVPFDPTFGSRVATVFGTTLGAHELDEDNVIGYFGADTRVPTPSRTINALPNVPAHHVAKLFGANGYLATINTACAAGTQAIGIASDLIQLGHADLVIAGGVEAILNDYSIASFDAMGVLARGYNDAPDRASRPFEASRSGFVIGEGAAALVVESLEHAIRRNAQPLAEVLGYAAVSDGYHMAALDPTGDGIVRCMQQALSNSCVSADAVDLINAHGTGTLSNDSTETLAIKRVLGSRAYEVPVVSTKSMLGHALAASGAIEAIACIDSLQTGVMHPTINLDEADPACDLDYVPHTARQMLGLRVAMSNSFGLGGQNASILFGKR